MLSKIKGIVKPHSKKLAIIASVLSIACMSCITSFAAEATDTVGTSEEIMNAFQTGLSTLQSDVLKYMAIVIPSAVAILAVYIGVRKAFNFVKGLIGR